MKTRSSTATADLSHLVKPSRLTENPRDAWKDQQGFNPVSLGHWKSAAERAGISMVPADLVHSIPVETILNYDRPNPEQKGAICGTRRRVRSQSPTDDEPFRHSASTPVIL